MILVVSVKHCVGQSNPNAAQSAGNSNAGGTVVDLGGGKTGIIAAGAVGTGSNTPVTPPKPTNQFTSSTAVISPGGTAAVGLVFHVRQPQPTDPDYEEKKKIIIDPAAIKARNEARAKAAAAKEQPPSNSGSLTTTTTLPRNTDPNVSPPNSNPTVPPSTLQNQNQPPSQPPSSPTPSTRTPP